MPADQTTPPPLPPVRDLAAELVDRGDGWHVSPELMPAQPTAAEHCPVCGIPTTRHYAIRRDYWPDLTTAERDAVVAHEQADRAVAEVPMEAHITDDGTIIYPDAPPADGQLSTPAVAAWASLLTEAQQDRDRYLTMLTDIGDAISPTGERPAEALDTLADDVTALAARCDQTEEERDQARRDLDHARAAGDVYRRQYHQAHADLALYRPVIDAASTWRATWTPIGDIPTGKDVALINAVDDFTTAALNRVVVDRDPDCGCTPPCGHGTYATASVPAPRAPEPDADHEAILAAIGDARIRIWFCPVPGHSDRRGPNGDPVLTVEWDEDGTAHCLAPGCDRTSADPSTQDSAGKRSPSEPRETTPPPQGDRTHGDDHAPQTPAEPDGTAVNPQWLALVAAGAAGGDDGADAVCDAYSLGRGDGYRQAAQATSTTPAAAPGPQDIPQDWMHVHLRRANIEADLDVPDAELLDDPRTDPYRQAIRSAYRVGYAAAFGHEITVSPEGDYIHIGDRTEPTSDAIRCAHGSVDCCAEPPAPPQIEQLLAQHRDDYALAETDQERAEILGDLLADWYQAWPDTAAADPHQPIAAEIVAMTSETLIGDTDPSPAEIRAHALTAATRLMAGADLDLPNALVRDLEQITIGMADRMAEWIATGDYDWMSTGPESSPVLLTQEHTEEHHGRTCAHCGDPIHHDGHHWRHTTTRLAACRVDYTEATP